MNHICGSPRSTWTYYALFVEVDPNMSIEFAYESKMLCAKQFGLPSPRANSVPAPNPLQPIPVSSPSEVTSLLPQDKKSCRSPKEASRNAGTVAGRHVLGDQFVENVVVKRDTFAGAGAFDVLDEIDPIIIKGGKNSQPPALIDCL